MNIFSKLTDIRPKEFTALLMACAYFFLILCSYYVIRPIRDEMAIANGVVNIPWIHSATVIALVVLTPVFGWVTTRFRTREFLSYCTIFFASHLVVFYFLFDVPDRPRLVTQSFFVWVNVFNMFIVSLFWSFMNDVFSREQTQRLFAFIAAGGTAGAICGPIITVSLVGTIGLPPLLLISASILTLSVFLIRWFVKWNNDEYDNHKHAHNVEDKALSGSIFGGLTSIFKSRYLLGICCFVLLYALSITFVQIRQAELIEATYSNPAERTQLFAFIDLIANSLVLFFQLFLTSRIIKYFGFSLTLLAVPLGITIGFGLMAAMPILMVMICMEIFRRVGDYAIMKPAREMLFSVVSREDKYKAKNFIDTAVLRTGSASSSWVYTAVKALGAGGASVAGVSIFLGLAWCAIAVWLGRAFMQRQRAQQTTTI